jgi:hypothetical protein
LAGKFKPTKRLYREAAKAQDLNIKLFDRAKAAGVIRSDVEVVDIALLLEQLASVQIGDLHRTAELRQRYLTLILVALHAPATTPLPGRPPDCQEVNGRWDV